MASVAVFVAAGLFLRAAARPTPRRFLSAAGFLLAAIAVAGFIRGY